ncbi:hypothetical protein E308F_29800 [Moorella sp. E308F]|uniref:hypothetical protein n=1 Tax=Moorella sp. E308F TaxID=2572682 RepID=UPI0010FFC419|nr:hypothetical protein [Moorella sp. E308F]GEA16734.1 hypothetical protein E308F_29800 [Moorella sp. E308F]
MKLFRFGDGPYELVVAKTKEQAIQYYNENVCALWEVYRELRDFYETYEEFLDNYIVEEPMNQSICVTLTVKEMLESLPDTCPPFIFATSDW